MSTTGRLVGLARAACQLRDADALRLVFVGHTDDVCDTITSAILAGLMHDLPTWGWATQHCVTTASRAIGAELRKRIAIPPAPKLTEAEYSKQQMTRLAFRVLRGGTTAPALVKHMRHANSQLTAPLPPDRLDSLIVWCAERHLEDAKNAG